MMPPPEPPVLCQSPGEDRNNQASTEVLSVCSQPEPGPGGRARPVSQTVALVTPAPLAKARREGYQEPLQVLATH